MRQLTQSSAAGVSRGQARRPSGERSSPSAHNDAGRARQLQRTLASSIERPVLSSSRKFEDLSGELEGLPPRQLALVAILESERWILTTFTGREEHEFHSTDRCFEPAGPLDDMSAHGTVHDLAMNYEQVSARHSESVFDQKPCAHSSPVSLANARGSAAASAEFTQPNGSIETVAPPAATAR